MMIRTLTFGLLKIGVHVVVCGDELKRRSNSAGNALGCTGIHAECELL